MENGKDTVEPAEKKTGMPVDEEGHQYIEMSIRFVPETGSISMRGIPVQDKILAYGLLTMGEKILDGKFAQMDERVIQTPELPRQLPELIRGGRA